MLRLNKETGGGGDNAHCKDLENNYIKSKEAATM
jgi:hypothetical protein